MKNHISENFPKLIRDFFLYDDSESDGTAHAPIDFPFEMDRKGLLEDAKRLPWDTDCAIARCTIVQNKHNKGETGTDYVVRKDTCIEPAVDLDQFPAIKKLVENLNSIGPVTYMSFKNMFPGEYLPPHMDSTQGPMVVYCPITWPTGCLFKVYNQGLVDFSDLRPNIVENGNNIHSVINDGTESRFTFSFYADWSSPGWSKILRTTKLAIQQ